MESNNHWTLVELPHKEPGAGNKSVYVGRGPPALSLTIIVRKRFLFFPSWCPNPAFFSRKYGAPNVLLKHSEPCRFTFVCFRYNQRRSDATLKSINAGSVIFSCNVTWSLNPFRLSLCMCDRTSVFGNQGTWRGTLVCLTSGHAAQLTEHAR